MRVGNLLIEFRKYYLNLKDDQKILPKEIQVTHRELLTSKNSSRNSESNLKF